MNNELEIFEYSEEGYNKTMSYKTWRVAFLNFAEKFREDNIKYLERHTLTDEVFVLLQGKATLLIGKDLARTEMQQGKIYNIKNEAWHNIVLEENSKILIIENEDTSPDNTEYYYL